MQTWTLKQLETFVWLAKLGNFRRTAERLNTTQPNITVRISSLEDALGVRLFERDASSVTLTASGRDLVSYAERALAAAEEFSARSGRAGDQSGILRVGATELIANTWLRPYLRALKLEFPNVDIELTVDLSVNLIRELLSRTLDLAFLLGPISDFNISNLELGHVKMVWVASPSLNVDANELSSMTSHTILSHTRQTPMYVETAAHFRDNWPGRVRLVPCSSLAVCMQMAIEGFGVTTLPEPLVRAPVEAGELVVLPYKWSPSPVLYTASYGNSPASYLVKRAAEIAKEHAAWR
jgi:DNA-binding transcriptional LysR family regulator